MKTNPSKLIHVFLIPAVFAAATLSAYEPQIKLSGRKDVVLSTETRATVLKIGLFYLTQDGNEFAASIDDVSDPFTFEGKASTEVVSTNEDIVENQPEPTVVYDDAMVLDASAQSFAKKVRGSITRGEVSFLQLDGGTLLRPGTSFPVRIPEAGNQSFTLTITEITSSGYTLQIGENTRKLTFDNKPQSGSGSIEFTNP